MAKDILAETGKAAGEKSQRLIRAIIEELADATDNAKKMAQHVDELTQEMKTLVRDGIIDASPHYQQGKYLYLIYPQRDGDRERRYIGNDQQRIASALASVERCRKYKERLQLANMNAARLLEARNLLALLTRLLTKEA